MRGSLKVAGLLVLAAFGLLLGSCDPEPVRKPPLPVWVALTGSSMLPEYADAGYVEVDVNFPYKNLKVGDDVMLLDISRTGGDKRTFHRLVEKQGNRWVTQGLNRVTNPHPDALLLSESIYEGKGTGRRSIILMPPPKDAP